MGGKNHDSRFKKKKKKKKKGKVKLGTVVEGDQKAPFQ